MAEPKDYSPKGEARAKREKRAKAKAKKRRKMRQEGMMEDQESD
ncbi:MAG: hypothetical protein ACYS9X_11175 [Planctomycetota bacterium]|jgi:hypothetical protein